MAVLPATLGFPGLRAPASLKRWAESLAHKNSGTPRAHAAWDEFNARHGRRLVIHFTPLHAGWVKQIELRFGIYSCRVLRYASHTSTAHLHQRSQAFIAQRNAAPRPFKWTFAGFDLQTGEPRMFATHAQTPRQNPRR